MLGNYHVLIYDSGHYRCWSSSCSSLFPPHSHLVLITPHPPHRQCSPWPSLVLPIDPLPPHYPFSHSWLILAVVVVSCRCCRLLPSSSITWMGSVVVVVVRGRGGDGCPSVIAGEHETTGPHPSGEGRGTGGSWEWGGVARAQAAVKNQPTSLNRGEGLVSGWLRANCGGEGGGEDGSGGGMRGISTVMRLMLFLNSAPPPR